jgi:hypothetical protein
MNNRQVEIPAQLLEMLTALADTIGNLTPATDGVESLLTVAEVCAELKVSPRTFHEWRAKGTGPACHKLPNNELRIERAIFTAWLGSRKEAA